MREIKFRIWFEVEKNMDYDPSTDDSLVNENFTPHFGEVYMQYTGLKDKNGVEIYEGDIVRRVGGGLLGDSTKPLFTGEVIFTNNGYKAKYLYSEPGTAGKVMHEAQGNLFNRSELEVIGNIYENPELLEQSA